MRYDKKDRPKVIVLLTLLILVWAFIGIRFAVLSREAKARRAAEESRRQAAAVQVAQQPTQPGTAASFRLAALVTPVEPPKDDPFRPIIPPRGTAPRRTRTTEAPRPEPILPPSTAGYQSSNLHLTGVILGNPSTAVLRVGDEHYVVREGDWLDSELQVAKIATGAVTIRDKRSSYVLRLGR